MSEPECDEYGVPYVINAVWFTEPFESFKPYYGMGFPLHALAKRAMNKHWLLLLYINTHPFDSNQYEYIDLFASRLPSTYKLDRSKPGWITRNIIRAYCVRKFFSYTDPSTGRTRPTKFQSLGLSFEQVHDYYRQNLSKYTFKHTRFNRFGELVCAPSKVPTKVIQVAVNDATFTPKTEEPAPEPIKHNVETPQLDKEQAAMAVVVGDTNSDGRVDAEDIQPIDKNADHTVTEDEIKEERHLTEEQYQEQLTQAAAELESGDTIAEPTIVVRSDDSLPNDITVKEVVDNPNYKPGVNFYLNLIVYLLHNQYPQTALDWMSWVSNILGLVGLAAKVISNDLRQTGRAQILALGKRVMALLKQIRDDGHLELDRRVYIDEGGLTDEEFDNLNQVINQFQGYLVTMEEELDNIRRNYEVTKADLRIRDVIDINPSYKSLADRVDRISRNYVRL